MEKRLPERINALLAITFDPSDYDGELSLEEIMSDVRDRIAENWKIDPDLFIFQDENGEEIV